MAIISIEDALDQVFSATAQNPTPPPSMVNAMPMYVDTATAVVEFYSGTSSTTAKVKVADGGTHSVLLPDVNVTVTSVSINGAAMAATAYKVDAEAGIVYAVCGAFPWGIQSVTVNYTAGSATPPANLQLAARELVRHLYQSSKQGGSARRAEQSQDTVATPFGFAIPRRVIELCQLTPGAPGFA